jgi:orsellenic acid P450 oxidase
VAQWARGPAPVPTGQPAPAREPDGELIIPPPVGGFDPTDGGVRRDPYPYYRWLLRHDPVHRGARDVWYVSRFADVRAVLGDERFSRAGIREFWRELIGPGLLSRIVGDIIMFQDEPDHGRLRQVVAPAFSPAALRGYEPRVYQLVDDLVAAAAPRGALDIVADLAYPLALTVIVDLLGLPRDDRAEIGRWSRAIGRTLDRGADADQIAAGHAAVAEFSEYVVECVAARESGPASNLLDLMLVAHRRGRLSRNEIVSTVVTFIFTGHETVANQIGTGLLCLLRHPAQLRLVRAEPSRVPAAVEECLRFEPSVQSNSRQLSTDVHLGGQWLRSGDLVVLLAGAANRDPLRFRDPDRFDITRQPGPSLSFGAGMRYCLGSYLARLELRAALAALVRLPDLRLAGDAALEYQPRTMFRGLASLPVRFDRTVGAPH